MTIDFSGFLDAASEDNTTPSLPSNLTDKPSPKSLIANLPDKVTTGFTQDTAQQLLAYCDAYFHRQHVMPTVELLVGYWPDSKSFLLSSEFTDQLRIRGLPYNELLTPDGYPVGFVNAANLILDHSDRRSKPAKLKSIGLTTRQWNMWLKLPKCREYVEKEVNDVFTLISPVEAKQSLARAVEQGDLNAVKYFHELTGVYRPGQESLVNLAAVLAAVMEILVKYVEPSIFPQVAQELDQVIEATGKELGSGN
jgi:hypothetical protein